MARHGVWRALWAFLLPSLIAAKLVREEITLTWDLGAPNGQVREMIKMNDGFPGPHFAWDEGDDIEVNQKLFHLTNSVNTRSRS